MFGDSDNAVFLADMGEMVLISGRQALGIFDQPSAEGAGIVDQDYTVIGMASNFGSAKFGDAATIRGNAYTVKTVFILDDGAFVRVHLSKD